MRMGRRIELDGEGLGNGFLVSWALDGVWVGFTTQHDYRDTFFFLIPGFCFFLGLDT